MDVKEAVRTAKAYVADLFAEEGLSNLGLEEVEFDDNQDVWRVTVGFSRPWNTTRNALTIMSGENAPRRAYRIVSIKDDGTVISLMRRDRSSE